MTDRDALLRSICENPDDDAPRLVYADWLDEHGDPRQAEFIRVQIELATILERQRDGHPLASREQAAWRELRKWRYAPPNWTTLTLSTFARGFNTVWVGDVSKFLTVAVDCLRLGPIHSLRLYVQRGDEGEPSIAEAVANQPALAPLRHVAVWGGILTDAWVERLLGTPYSARWTQLTLTGNRLTDVTCQHLAESPLVQSGCAVVLESRGITEAGRRIIERAFGARQSVARPS